MEERIDVIIPAYNAHKSIVRCLASIAMQTVIDDVDVTVVNDASDHDYSEEIARFKGFMNVREIGYEENGGPGFARNYGYEHTNGAYVTFIDADDTFMDAFALYKLRRNIQSDPKCHMCVGMFLEEHFGGDRWNTHQQDLVWMFGKMYTRAWLDKYNIRMNSTRSNEDTGFNKLVMLCSSAEEQIKFIPDPVYIWHATEASITRANDCDYSFNASFGGWTDNMIWCISEARKRFPFKENVNYFTVETMCQLYLYYIESHARRPDLDVQNWNHCLRYYKEIYRRIETLVTDEIFATCYNVATSNFYKSGRNNGFVPCMSVQEFLLKLKSETATNSNENDDQN